MCLSRAASLCCCAGDCLWPGVFLWLCVQGLAEAVRPTRVVLCTSGQPQPKHAGSKLAIRALAAQPACADVAAKQRPARAGRCSGCAAALGVCQAPCFTSGCSLQLRASLPDAASLLVFTPTAPGLSKLGDWCCCCCWWWCVLCVCGGGHTQAQRAGWRAAA
jgi:hypothetical protein